MPTPVSTTSRRAERPSPDSRTRTDPPSGVNLIAFDSRLMTTCRMRLRSASTSCRPSASTPSRMAFRSASGCIESMVWRTSSSRSNTVGRRSSLPASTFARSRTSLMSSSRWRPEPWMWPANSWTVAASCPSGEIGRSRSSEKPMIELSGVRSSWLMAARKSLFAALADRSSTMSRSRSARTSSRSAARIARREMSCRTARSSATNSGLPSTYRSRSPMDRPSSDSGTPIRRQRRGRSSGDSSLGSLGAPEASLGQAPTVIRRARPRSSRTATAAARAPIESAEIWARSRQMSSAAPPVGSAFRRRTNS